MGFRQIDADDYGQIGRTRDLAFEAFGMGEVGRLQDGSALLPKRGSGAEVHRRRGHEADAGVAMLVVVPGEELARMRSGVLEAPEACGELGPVLEGFELRLRERIVVRDPRPREGSRHTEIDQELGGG